MRTFALCTLIFAIAGCSGSRSELENQRKTIETLSKQLAEERAAIKKTEVELAATKQKLQSMTNAHELMRDAFNRLSEQNAQDEAEAKAREDSAKESLEKEFALLTEHEKKRIDEIKRGAEVDGGDVLFARGRGRPFLFKVVSEARRKQFESKWKVHKEAIDFLKLPPALRDELYVEDDRTIEFVLYFARLMQEGKELNSTMIEHGRDSIYLRDRIAEYQKGKQ